MKLSDVHITPYSTVLLDRDGTLNVHLVGDYVKRPDELELIPGAPEAVAAMTKAGKHVYIITNQRGIGKGLMTEDDLAAIHRRMLDAVEQAGGHIDGIYYATAVDKTDPQRKPQTGMWQQLLRDHPEVNPATTLMIGDGDVDEAFARNCGIAFCRVDSLKKENDRYTWHLAD